MSWEKNGDPKRGERFGRVLEMGELMASLGITLS